MEWGERVEFTYRVYAKWCEDTMPRFVETRRRFEALFPGAQFGDVREYTLPCAPEDAARAKASGLILQHVGPGESVCLLLREMVVSVPCEENGSAAVLERASAEFGQVFAHVRIVRDALTGVVAV